jgi:hypothetical protein
MAQKSEFPHALEALLLGFFELRGDLFDAKVVGVGRRCCA